MFTSRLTAAAVTAAGCYCFVATACPTSAAGLPAPDHIVVVFEENHSAQSILGNGSAPYMNGLATQGVSFTNFFGIAHPSQGNYLHLFSGRDQGVIDDALPAGTPFNTPNLGAALRS